MPFLPPSSLSFLFRCLAPLHSSSADSDGLQITLQKALRGELWPSVFKGHGKLDEAAAADVSKQLLLERFGSEHPGFDFSQAEVNGTIPDARTFMGGLKYTS